MCSLQAIDDFKCGFQIQNSNKFFLYQKLKKAVICLTNFPSARILYESKEVRLDSKIQNGVENAQS